MGFSFWNFWPRPPIYIYYLECFSNFFSNNIINNIRLWHSLFNFFNHKNVFWSIWSVIFCRNSFIYWYANNITNFKFRIFIINLFAWHNICAWFTFELHQQVSFKLCCDMYYCIYQLYHLIYQYPHFLVLKSCINKFCSLRF